MNPLTLALSILLAFALLPTIYAATRTRQLAAAARDLWPLTWRSTLASVLAFNLTFFIQEVFLVWPKVVAPGLEPTLFHNNHTWSGTHPYLELLQGTGAIGTMCSGAVAWYWLARHASRGLEMRLFVFWMAVLGFISALPQVVIGAFIHANDVGRAMTGLGFTPLARWVAAGAALLIMAVLCRHLAPYLLGMVEFNDATDRRARVAFWLGFLPSILAVPLIVPFRVPNHPLEILLPPLVDALIAGSWLWAFGASMRSVRHSVACPSSTIPLWLALFALLAFFHIVLAPGVSF